MNAQRVDRCDICGRGRLDLAVSLGASPPTCAMHPIGDRPVSETHYPLELLYCARCAHGMLSVAVNPEVMFPPDYPYSSGNSRALHQDFQNLADSVQDDLEPGDLVVDIGANDGTLLSKFAGCRTVGVEPTGQAKRINGHAYQEFFTSELATRIRARHGPARIVTACNVMAHVADVNDVMEGVQILMGGGGCFIAENHDLRSVLDGQWDTIYHEHLRFFSVFSFASLLQAYGFAGACELVPTHGGSFRFTAKREPGDLPEFRDYEWELGRLALDAARARRAIRSELHDDQVTWGIGATARATTIINYCGLDVEDVECVAEVAGSDKIGHFIPGTRIPVIDEAELFTRGPDRVILFSWHMTDAIVPMLRERGYTGDIVVPLPYLRYV